VRAGCLGELAADRDGGAPPQLRRVHADAVVGPRYLVPTVQSQLPMIDRICQATRGTDRAAMLAAAAQFAEFCGWLYQDSGRPDSAFFWTNHALSTTPRS
jgi:hypothetical protein